MKVCVRLKLHAGETSRRVHAFDANHVSVLEVSGPPTLYRFDHVFDDDASNQEVFRRCAYDAFTRAVSGLDAAIMTYGQTGSGKTFTMLGPEACSFRADDESNGLIPQMMHKLLEAMNQAKAAGEITSFELSLSCVELYRQEKRDLFLPREQRVIPVGRYMCPRQEKIETGQDVVKLLRKISRAKATAGTSMNSRSSRGHTVACIVLKQTGASQQKNAISKLFMVDLAGNERLKRSGVSHAFG